MALVTNSVEIPKEFNSTSSSQISADGKKRLENIFYRGKKREFISNREEILYMIFKASMDCCEHHFGKKKDVSFSHEYRRDGLAVKSNESSVFINETILNSLLQYIYVVIYNSLDIHNSDVSFYCYKQLLIIINEQCNNTYTLPSEDAFIDIMEKYPNIRTLNVAADVYWGMITFLMLHELSHIFLEHHAAGKGQAIAEQEREADKEAFLIFLDMIYNRDSHKKLEFLEEYIYLAPMMTIDFFTLVYFVDGTISGNRYSSNHPPHEERKNILFDLFDKWERDFDSVNGNAIYNGYVDVVEKFKNALFNANEQGMLEQIKRTREKKVNEKNIVDFISELTDDVLEVNTLNGSLDRESIDRLIDTHVCFIMDENTTDFVLVNLKGGPATSFKLANVIVNFRSMLEALLGIALAAGLPSSSAEAARIVLLLTYKILGVSTKGLSQNAAQVLIFLHQNDAYSNEVCEEEILSHLSSRDLLTKEALNAAINELLKVRCIDIVQGNVILLEKVYLR